MVSLTKISDICKCSSCHESFNFTQKNIVEIEREEPDYNNGKVSAYLVKFVQCPFCYNPSVISRRIIGVVNN